MADIGVPDYETRMAILRKIAESDIFDIDDEVLSYIANNIKSNVRELEGALNKLLAGACCIPALALSLIIFYLLIYLRLFL